MANAKDVYNTSKSYEHLRTEFMKLKTMKIEGKNIKVNPSNLKYAQDWLLYKEDRLERAGSRNEVSRIRNAKTLYKEIMMLQSVLYWFNDYDLKQISQEDMKKVFGYLEKGLLKSRTGKPLTEGTRKDYYNKVFRGRNTFFGYLKINDRAKDILIAKFTENEEVRFFTRETFETIVNNAQLLSHKVCFWLLYDTGVEVSAIVQLRKSNFIEEYDKATNQSYYKVQVSKEISKKTRQKRYLDLLYPETNALIKSYLSNFKDDQLIFNFNPPAIYKALKLIVRKHNLRTVGDVSKEITTKDFRSSCATNLLNLNYQAYQVNVRLGHTISSRELNRYISYLNLDQKKPRQEIQKANFEELLEKFNQVMAVNRKLELEVREIDTNWKKLSQYVEKQMMREEYVLDKLREMDDRKIHPEVKELLEILMDNKESKDWNMDTLVDIFPLHEERRK